VAPLLLALLLQAPSPPPVPARASGWVRDEAGVLGEATEARLNGILATHQKATSNQVVVLTVASLGGNAVESVALLRASELKIGRDDVDNGVLLLVAPNERKVRIEVGYGLEGALPDARCAGIIRDEILPRFRSGDLDGGVERGVRAILASIEGSYAPPTTERAGPDRARFPPALGFDGQLILGVVGGLLLAPFVRRLVQDGGWFRRALAGAGTVLAGGALALVYPLALLGLALAALLSFMKDAGASGSGYTYGGSGGSWSSSSDWSSSGSDSSFSGGGGDFGGGGASGSW
jgi:uncharacterized protein